MSFLAIIGIVLILLAIFHVIPLVLGIVLGIVLILIGGWPYYGHRIR